MAMNAAALESMLDLNTSRGLIIEAFSVPTLHMFKLITCPLDFKLRIANTSLSYPFLLTEDSASLA